MSIVIDKNNFWNRFGALYTSWKKGGPGWGGAKVGESTDAVVFLYGRSDDDGALYSRSSAIQLALLGVEISDMVIAFTADNTMHMLMGPKQIKIISTVGDEGSYKGATFKLNCIEKKKGDEAKNSLAPLLDAIKDSKDGKRYGYLKKDWQSDGKFSKLVRGALGGELVDVASGVAGVLAVKDSNGIGTITKSAELTTRVLRKFLLDKIEGVIDDEKDIKHSLLAEETEDVIVEPKKVKSKLDPNDVESCYTPIIMSGGNYDLKPSAESNDDNLHYGTIICAVGCRYKGYCSNIARTYFINPTKDCKVTYEALTAVYQACKSHLRVGKRLNEVYAVAVETIKKKAPGLLPHFTTSCGFGMGLEFREGLYVINERTSVSFSKGWCSICVWASVMSSAQTQRRQKRLKPRPMQ